MERISYKYHIRVQKSKKKQVLCTLKEQNKMTKCVKRSSTSDQSVDFGLQKLFDHGGNHILKDEVQLIQIPGVKKTNAINH